MESRTLTSRIEPASTKNAAFGQLWAEHACGRRAALPAADRGHVRLPRARGAEGSATTQLGTVLPNLDQVRLQRRGCALDARLARGEHEPPPPGIRDAADSQGRARGGRFEAAVAFRQLALEPQGCL